MGTTPSKETMTDTENAMQGLVTPRPNYVHPTNQPMDHALRFPNPPMPPNKSSEKSMDVVEYEDIIPTVFRWEHGGRNVYITGTFNGWNGQIPMHRSGNDFSYIHNLKRGKHVFKFIVDDEWRFAPDQPTIVDIEGRINNFVDVADFQPYVGDDSFFAKSRERKIPESEFHQTIPDITEYTKEPPALPPHLRNIILNKPAVNGDTHSLPTPKPVSLHHLYCTSIKDGMMVLGVTERYRHKYITQVFYSTMPSPNSS